MSLALNSGVSSGGVRGAGVSGELTVDDDTPTRIDRVFAWDGLIWLYGAGLFVPSVLFTRRYPLPGHTGVLHDLGGLSHFGVAEYLGYVAGMTAMFVSYVLALYHCRLRPSSAWRTPVILTAVASGVAMARMYPVSAIDIFIYAVRSRLWTAYGYNPIAVAPAIVPRDPWLHFAGEWRTSVSPYGPLWNWIAAPGTRLSGERLWFALAYYKSLAFVCFLAIGFVALHLSGQRDHPEAAVVWLWNPLVLWEGVGNGHNDLAMMLPVVLAIWAWEAKRPRLVIPLLVAAFAIKYVAILVIPLAALVLIRQARSAREAIDIATWSAIGSAVIVFASLAPFFDLHAIWSSLRAQDAIMLTSPAAMIADAFRNRPDAAEIPGQVRRVGTVLFVLIAVVQFALTWRTPARLVRAMYEVLFAYLLIAAWTFRPWYVIWLVALAALLPVAMPAARVVAWSAGALAAYALFIWVWHWWGADFSTIQNIAVPLMFGPAAVLTLYEPIRSLRFRARRRALLNEAGVLP
jgi:alpha-1,6-mannosyltransferase